MADIDGPTVRSSRSPHAMGAHPTPPIQDELLGAERASIDRNDRPTPRGILPPAPRVEAERGDSRHRSVVRLDVPVPRGPLTYGLLARRRAVGRTLGCAVGGPSVINGDGSPSAHFRGEAQVTHMPDGADDVLAAAKLPDDVRDRADMSSLECIIHAERRARYR